MTGPRMNPNLLTVPMYIAGRSIEEVKEELGLSEVTKLASNESPLGPSPMAVEAARAWLSVAHRYPGVGDRNLRRKLASRLDPALGEENIVVGNGGSDVLRMIIQAFVFDGGNVVMCQATFPLYHIITTSFGGTPRKVPPTPGFQHDLDAMLEQIDADTRLLFLCSPNNPTGNIITQAEADHVIEQVPDHVVVVFDEAYHDFVTDPEYADSLNYVKQGRNVLVVRSFSKTAGLANMRAGFLVGPAELADYVRHARLPFHTSDIVLAAASASLDDEAYQSKLVELVITEREFLWSSFRALNLECLPSQANFVTLFNLPVEPAVFIQRLLQRGFIVRGMAPFGFPGGVRISVGTHSENEKLVHAIQDVLVASQ